MYYDDELSPSEMMEIAKTLFTKSHIPNNEPETEVMGTKRQISLQVSEGLLSDIDILAKYIGLSRNSLVNQALSFYLACTLQHLNEHAQEHHHATNDDRLINAYSALIDDINYARKEV